MREVFERGRYDRLDVSPSADHERDIYRLADADDLFVHEDGHFQPARYDAPKAVRFSLVGER